MAARRPRDRNQPVSAYDYELSTDELLRRNEDTQAGFFAKTAEAPSAWHSRAAPPPERHEACAQTRKPRATRPPPRENAGEESEKITGQNPRQPNCERALEGSRPPLHRRSA